MKREVPRSGTSRHFDERRIVSGIQAIAQHLIESKSRAGPGPADALLRSRGVRPVRISKYCLGVALLHPDTAANPWNRLLNRQFAWQRTAEATPVRPLRLGGASPRRPR